MKPIAYEVPFSIRFHGDLSGHRLALLGSELGMFTTLQPLEQSGDQVGVAPIDADTGLYLVRGETEGEWLLECRAYGDSADGWIERWHRRALWVVGQLDVDAEDFVAGV